MAGGSVVKAQLYEFVTEKVKKGIPFASAFDLFLISPHLRHWIDRSTLKKLEVARSLEKSAHPWCRDPPQDVFYENRHPSGVTGIKGCY
ncbi:UNVERIFIED_CONTAM: hypothetical protein NCL1_48922 [Trichonephila clavipes]